MTPSPQRSLPEILFEIGKAVGSDHDLSELLAGISELACELVGAQAVSIMLLDADGDRLLAKASYGLLGGNQSRVSFAVGEGVAGWVASRGEPALIDDVRTDARFVARRASTTVIESMACVPLLARGEPIGVMTATSPQLATFNKDDLDMLSFVAKTIALDIENVRLRRIAVTDALTGCFNREFLQNRLPAEVAAAERGAPLAVALVDVDHFKSINDRFGHDVGDRALVGVADRLRGAIRADDALVRYGGEEFLALLPHTGTEAAHEVGERMRGRLADTPVSADGHQLELRVSVGVAEYQRGEGADAFVRRADAALYAAKSGGRNRVEVAP